MEQPSVVISSIKRIIWISQCTGQLPILWDRRAGWWHVAPWYHPQFFYFLLLILARVVVYTSISYTIIASQFSFRETTSFSALVISEMAYIWLRLFLPSYLLLFTLKTLAAAVRKLEKIDLLLCTVTVNFAAKPRKLTAFLYTVTTLIVSVILFVQKDYYIWHARYLPSDMFCRIIIAWMGLDLLSETAVVAQFCLAATLLQQRLSEIGDQLSTIPEQNFSPQILTDGAAFRKIHTPDSVSRLRYTYSLVYLAAEEILNSFSLPLFCITLGEILLLTFHVYGVANFERMQTSSEAVPMVAFSLLILAIHAIYILSTLFHFADKMNTEVSSLKTLLQTKVCCTDIQDPTMKAELREFQQILSTNPFPQTSAAGLYNVGKSLVPGIIGVIFTYLVVLMQFDNKPQPCGSTNATAPSA